MNSPLCLSMVSEHSHPLDSVFPDSTLNSKLMDEMIALLIKWRAEDKELFMNLRAEDHERQLKTESTLKMISRYQPSSPQMIMKSDVDPVENPHKPSGFVVEQMVCDSPDKALDGDRSLKSPITLSVLSASRERHTLAVERCYKVRKRKTGFDFQIEYDGNDAFKMIKKTRRATRFLCNNPFKMKNRCAFTKKATRRRFVQDCKTYGMFCGSIPWNCKSEIAHYKGRRSMVDTGQRRRSHLFDYGWQSQDLTLPLDHDDLVMEKHVKNVRVKDDLVDGDGDDSSMCLSMLFGNDKEVSDYIGCKETKLERLLNCFGELDPSLELYVWDPGQVEAAKKLTKLLKSTHSKKILINGVEAETLEQEHDSDGSFSRLVFEVCVDDTGWERGACVVGIDYEWDPGASDSGLADRLRIEHSEKLTSGCELKIWGPGLTNIARKHRHINEIKKTGQSIILHIQEVLTVKPCILFLLKSGNVDGMAGYKPSLLMKKFDGEGVEVSAKLEPYMRMFSDFWELKRKDQLKDDQTQDNFSFGATKRSTNKLISAIPVAHEDGYKEWVFKREDLIAHQWVKSSRSSGHITKLFSGVCNEFINKMQTSGVVSNECVWDPGGLSKCWVVNGRTWLNYLVELAFSEYVELMAFENIVSADEERVTRILQGVCVLAFGVIMVKQVQWDPGQAMVFDGEGEMIEFDGKLVYTSIEKNIIYSATMISKWLRLAAHNNGDTILELVNKGSYWNGDEPLEWVDVFVRDNESQNQERGHRTEFDILGKCVILGVSRSLVIQQTFSSYGSEIMDSVFDFFSLEDKAFFTRGVLIRT